MNAAETIAAAIEKLETQRDVAEMGKLTIHRFNDGRLEDVWIDSEYWRADGSGSIRTALVLDRNQGPKRFDTAELIVTLHRTIDAQLAILRRTLDDLNNLLVYPSDLDIELDLARAILGES